METVVKSALDMLDFANSNIYVLNFMLAIIIILFQRKDPKSVWGWLLILYTIPLFGFILYLLFGTDLHKQKMFKTKEIEDKINEAIRTQEDIIYRKGLKDIDPHLAEFSDMILYNLQTSRAILTDDNKITVYTDGREKFKALGEDIRNAKKYIHIQYYIIKNDVLFQAIKEDLIKKAAEGVEVRILYDSMGCRGISNKYWKTLKAQGIKVGEFFPALLKRFHLRMNYRNHRKIVVIDGKIGYVGGFNIGKEYIGLDKKFGYWRDTHLKIEGSAVRDLQIRFALDWNYATKENLTDKDDYFDISRKKIAGESKVQIVASGPDSVRQHIRDNYLRMITKAEKSIYIQTPYFIPDESILNALFIAVVSGVEVNLMIPCKPDHPFVYWATCSYMGDLLAEGANCYIYNNGFLHTKGMIVDEKIMCYGTANMDIRSFQLNFEINAVIYDEKEAANMQRIFMEDVKKSKKITKEIYARRPIYIRLKEQFSRLLSPLM